MAQSAAMNAVLILSAVDKATRVINGLVNNATKKLDSVKKSADAVSKSAFATGKNFAIAGAAMAAPLIASTKMAMDFEEQMSNVATLVDTNTENMAKMGEEVLDISRKVPVKINDLTSALYDVRSAGVSAADAMSVLDASARLSVAGLSTTKEATNIMTSAMNAFKSEGLSATQVSDMIFKTVKAGKTTVSELAQAFGATAPIIQGAGVKLADFQAATAALTTVGTPAAQAQNQLRASIISLQKPTKEMQALLDSLGAKTGSELIEKSGGMGFAFEKLIAKAKESGTNFAKAAGSVEAMSAMMSVAGATNKAYRDTLTSMTDGSNAMAGAFDKQSKTGKAQFEMLKNQMQAVAITAGNALLPVLIEVIQSVTPIIQRIGDWIKQNPQLFGGIVKVVAVMATFSFAMSGASFLIGGIAKGISIATKAFSILSKVVKIFTIVQWAVNAAMYANPIGLIVAGVAALIAGFVLLVIKFREVEAWFKRQNAVIKYFIISLGWPLIPIFALAKAIRWLIDNWNDLPGAFRRVGEKIKTFFSGIWDYIKAFPAKMWEAGKNMVRSLWDGMKSVAMAPINGIKSIAGKIRSFLPFSPAKEGPLKDIHRIRLMETIAATIKPGPAVKAMTGAMAGVAMAVAPGLKAGGQTINSSSISNSSRGGVTIHFSPTINVGPGVGGDAARAGVSASLREMAPELLRLLQQEMERKERRALK